MPRRYNDQPQEYEPPRKKSSTTVLDFRAECKQGQIFKDISGKQWKLGKAVGIGGFGEIYLASDKNLTRDVKTDASFVAKIERHSNGPLFVEINCYLRIGKYEMIEEWKKEQNLNHLGIPHYVASGSHNFGDEKFRFIILPRFKQDLASILHSKKLFNLKTVLTISSQIIDGLEYIHSRGYVHSDVKASNIMLGNEWKPKQAPSKAPKNYQIGTRLSHRKPKKITRNLRSLGIVNYVDDVPYFEDFLNTFGEDVDLKKTVGKKTSNLDEIYLLDYGLSSKYLKSNGEHREFCRDERKAHAGTVLFCSRDAHNGVASRRSDLESLGYNIIYWLTGSLPWMEDIEEPEVVERKKNRCFAEYKSFLSFCFSADCPNFLVEFFNYLNTLQFQEKPDYDYCKNLFQKALLDFGYKDDLKLDFDNLEGWGSKQKKLRKGNGRENKNIKVKEILISSIRPPLQSNNILYKRPKLRKKSQNKMEHNSMMNWSKILIDDPEVIIKLGRERKNTESSDSRGYGGGLTAEELEGMNPTYAMLEVFNKCKERGDATPKNKGEHCVGNIEGYTPAMMEVYLRIREREEFELAAVNKKINSKSKTPRKARKNNIKGQSPIRFSTRINKSQSTVVVKKEVLPVRKVKSAPMRRTYSLRG